MCKDHLYYRFIWQLEPGIAGAKGIINSFIENGIDFASHRAKILTFPFFKRDYLKQRKPSGHFLTNSRTSKL